MMTQTNDPKVKSDANQLLQEWCKEDTAAIEQITLEKKLAPDQVKKLQADKANKQASRVQALLMLAEPLVMVLANEAGNLRGAEKDAAVKQVAELLKAMPDDDREQHIRRIAKAAKTELATFRAMTKPVKKSKKDDDDGDVEAERITGGWINKHLIELCFDEEKVKTWFAVRYPDGRVDPHVEKVNIEGRTLKPIWPNSILTKHGVRLPSEIYDKPLTEKELMTITRSHINKYFDFGGNDFFEELAPQFVPFTYFADAFMETSYLRALGDYGTGKTRFLKAIGLICYRPIYVTGGSSPASLYHFLDTYKGTLVLNEADFGMSDEASIIAKILNGGTERDEGISKMKKDADGNMDIEMYNVFGPKVIATRKGFDDRAIESRCLTMEMVPMAPHPRIPRHLPPNYGQICVEIRNLWTTYRLFNAKESITIDESQTDYTLEARLSQVSGPLMNIITDPEVKESLKAFMREYNEREKTDRFQTKTARVVEGLMRAFAWGPVSDSPNDENRVYLKDIALATNLVTNEINKRMGDDDEEEKTDAKGKKSGGKFTSRGISGIMDKYLQLRTWRATDGTPDYKGTMYLDMNRDGDRVKALCERWGVKELARGSEKRPLIINLNDPVAMSQPVDKTRQHYLTND